MSLIGKRVKAEQIKYGYVDGKRTTKETVITGTVYDKYTEGTSEDLNTYYIIHDGKTFKHVNARHLVDFAID